MYKSEQFQEVEKANTRNFVQLIINNYVSHLNKHVHS